MTLIPVIPRILHDIAPTFPSSLGLLLNLLALTFALLALIFLLVLLALSISLSLPAKVGI